MSNLNKMFKKNGKKDMYISLTAKLGPYVKGIVEENKDINKLNGLDYEKLVNDFLNKKKNLEIKQSANVDEDTLIYEVIKTFIEYVPRRYCLVKNPHLKNNHTFKSIEEMFKFCPELKDYKYLSLKDLDVYLGEGNKPHFSKVSSEEPNKANITSKKTKASPLVINPRQKANESPLYNAPLIDLCTDKKTKIDDLSSLLVDFCVQKEKRIFVFDAGTGFGKSYSITEFIKLSLKNENLNKLINKRFYLTDRRNNVKQEVDEFITNIKNNKDDELLEESILSIYTNTDCIIEHLDAFKSLPDFYRNESYYKLLEYAEMHHTEKNSLFVQMVDENIEKSETIWRSFIKSELEKEFEKKKLHSYEDKLNYLKNDEKLGKIIEVYPNILIRDKEKKIIFMTIHKGVNLIDTIIEKEPIALNQSKDILKNSIIFFDESDAAAGTLLDVFAEQSTKTGVDLIEKTISCNNSFAGNNVVFLPRYKKLMSDEGYNKLSNRIALNNEAFKKLKDNYKIAYSTILEGNDDNHWLYSRAGSNVIYKSSSSNRYMIFENEQSVVIDECGAKKRGLDVNKLPKYEDFVKELYVIYIEYLRIFKEMANAEQLNDESLDQISAIKMVMGHMLFVSKDDINRTSIIRDISLITKENIDSIQKDYYYNPGSISRTQLPSDEKLRIQLYNYNLNTTPEAFVKSLVDSGAKVVFSSATARSRSVLSNFNLNWQPIAKEIYSSTPQAKKLEKEYINKLEKYKYKTNVVVESTSESDTENDIKEKIIKNFSDFGSKTQSFVSSELEKTIDEIKRNSSDIYYVLEALNIFYDMTQKINHKSFANLFVTKFSIKEDSSIASFINNVILKIHKNVRAYYTISKNLKDKEREFQEGINQDAICFLFAATETIMKGFNMEISIKPSLPKYESLIVGTNETGVLELEDAIKNEKIVKIDFTGLYIGNITYVYPVVKHGPEKDKSIIKCIYYVNSLKENGDISDKMFNELMIDILSGNETQSLFHRILNKYHIAAAAKVMGIVDQTCGRISRRNKSTKQKYITISWRILEYFYGHTKEDFFDKDTYNKQSYEARKVIDFIFTDKSDKINYVERNMDIKRVNNLINQALYENAAGKPKSLKILQNGIKKLSITKAEFDALPPFVRGMYTKKEGAIKYGYSFKDMNDPRLYAPNVYHRKVSTAALNVNREVENLLVASGIDISDLNEYILLPPAFNMFIGEIGEVISKHILKTIGYDVMELPDPIYEKMDFVLEKPDYVLTCDAKYYTEKTLKYDDIKELDKYFDEKTRAIGNYYHKKVVSIELNTRYFGNGLGLETKVHTASNGNKLITVPNIYISNGQSFSKGKIRELADKIKICTKD